MLDGHISPWVVGQLFKDLNFQQIVVTDILSIVFLILPSTKATGSEALTQINVDLVLICCSVVIMLTGIP